jgi:N-acyl-D-aspartate/D-glutamate deacylase
MGERGAAREPATADDVAAMAAEARAAVAAGALGFTTSRTLNHRTSRGEPTPTLTAGREELVGIARALGDLGAGVLQVVSDFADPTEEFATLRAMVDASGRPLSISIAQSPVAPERWRDLLELIDGAAADGLPVLGQVAVRPVGLLLGLDCTLHPFLTNPAFGEIEHLDAAGRARAMADPDRRARVLAAAADPDHRRLGGRLIGRFDLMYELGDPPDYEPDPATSLAARAGRERRDPAELAYDLLARDGGRTLLYLPFLNFADGNLDAVGEMLTHPRTIPGLADGGAHVGTICDASFPTTLLSWWGRDRPRGRIRVEELVRRHCRDTAAAVGLLDRGVLTPGHRADLNVIDFEHLTARRPDTVHDLPAGGRRLVQGADGYVHTLVAGEATRTDGERTGALPGRLVRGARPAPG